MQGSNRQVFVQSRSPTGGPTTMASCLTATVTRSLPARHFDNYVVCEDLESIAHRRTKRTLLPRLTEKQTVRSHQEALSERDQTTGRNHPY